MSKQGKINKKREKEKVFLIQFYPTWTFLNSLMLSKNETE